MTVVYRDACMGFVEVNHNSILTKLGCYTLEVCSMRLVKKLVRLMGRKGCDQCGKV